MDDDATKKLNKWLATEKSHLPTLLAKAKQLEAINKQVLTYLEKNNTAYCQVANVIGNKLILIVANGSIATQIRFQSVDLIKKFKQDPILKNIQQIECKVRPNQSNSIRTKLRKMDTLSASTAETIQKIAETIEDPRLQKIMQRIASRVIKPQPEEV